MKKKVLCLILCMFIVTVTGCGKAEKVLPQNASAESDNTKIESELAPDISAGDLSQETSEEQVSGQKLETVMPAESVSGNGTSSISSEEGSSDDSDSAGAAEKIAALLPVEVHFTDKTRDYKTDSGTELLSTDYRDPSASVKGNETATDAIREVMEEQKYNFAEKSGEYKAQAEKDNQENGPLSSAYYLNQSYEIQRCDDKLLSFQIITSDYTGGAHGMYGSSGITFDVRTGKKLTLDDISDDQSTFLNSCKEEILSQCAALPKNTLLVSSTQDLDNKVNKLLASDSWYFTKAGLKFVAGPYELAAYSVGSIPFTIPYDKMPGLKKDYQYTGNYEMETRDGNTITADLNGDGKQDTVTYDLQYDVDKNQSKVVFQVNGKDETDILTENKISLMGNASGVFYLIDLDTEDNSIEIAIPDSGEDDNSATYLFRYDGKKLKYLGNVPDVPSDNSFQTFGDGTILAATRLSLLETAYTEVLYRINDKDRIVKTPENWYVIKQYSGAEGKQHVHNILKNVTVYKDNDLKSDKVVLSAADGPVTFPKTDDEHWVKVVTADGRTLNMYLNDFNTIKSDNKEQAVTDTFSDIFLAD